MPWTLYRYILRELLKLLLLSSAVLVTVISFAAAVRPLSDGLLGPFALLKFIAYTTPTMLVFALPFAGAFAATLVFLRMASDNEITACSASGLSYVSVLLPVTLLGLVLTMGLFFSSNYIMPWFYQQAARTVEKDLVTSLINQLNRSQPYVMKRQGVVIYADSAEEIPITQELLEKADTPYPPHKLIRLQGVAVGKLDDTGRVRSDATAQQANVLVFRNQETGESYVNMTLINAMQYDGVTRDLFFSERLVPGTLYVPSPFEDEVEFLSLPQLRLLRKYPDRYDRVRDRTRELIDALLGEHLLQTIETDLGRRGGGVVILKGARQGERLLLRTPAAERDDTILRLTRAEQTPVSVEVEREGQIVRRFEAEWASLGVNQTQGHGEPTLQLELHNTRVADTSRLGGAVTELPSHVLPQLAWPSPILGSKRDQFKSWDALEMSRDRRYRKRNGEDANAVIRARHRLDASLNGLNMHITTQVHSRVASAIACLLLLLLGSLLSMRMKGQMALVVFFWSFMLAVVTIVIISTGKNLASGGETPLAVCLGVLWTGNVILAVVVGTVYCQIARH